MKALKLCCIVTAAALTFLATAASADEAMVGPNGCHYQKEKLLLAHDIEREGLAGPLRKFEERLKHGEEMFVPEKGQDVELYVVNCKTSDYPALWARVGARPILLIPREWLKQSMYR
ncbi:hypothetical protein K2Q00_00065 [Patescibacteria group bacterium]|nr:hypothetical protein [Patescibacteria group bacterium]